MLTSQESDKPLKERDTMLVWGHDSDGCCEGGKRLRIPSLQSQRQAYCANFPGKAPQEILGRTVTSTAQPAPFLSWQLLISGKWLINEKLSGRHVSHRNVGPWHPKTLTYRSSVPGPRKRIGYWDERSFLENP